MGTQTLTPRVSWIVESATVRERAASVKPPSGPYFMTAANRA